MKIVVDLFNQHSGDLQRLKNMAGAAKVFGADAVKIQILNSQRIWGDDSRKYLEMTDDEVLDFKKYCDNQGIPFQATVFDERGLELINDMGVDSYKIASITALKEKGLCEKILNMNKLTYISLGKFPFGEFPFGHDPNIRYLFCIAKYPTQLHEVKMPAKFDEKGYYGFSDHVIGNSAAILAYTRGAQYLEKHYTIDTKIKREFEKAHSCSLTHQTLFSLREQIKELAILRENGELS